MRRLISILSIMVLIIFFTGCAAHNPSLESGNVGKEKKTEKNKSSDQEVTKKEKAKIVLGSSQAIVKMLQEIIEEEFPGVKKIRLKRKTGEMSFLYGDGYRVGIVRTTIKLKPAMGIDEKGIKKKGYIIDITCKNKSFWTGALNPNYPIPRIKKAIPDLLEEYNLSYVTIKNVKIFELKEIITEFPSQGTGFLLGNRPIVITNYHVVGDFEKVDLFFQKGYKVKGRVVKRDKENDLAIVKFDEFRKKPIGFLIYPSYKVKAGQEISVIGFPLGSLLGQNPSITKGIIAATVGMENDSRHYRITTEINPGNSGGPLINKNGRVIGIVSHSVNQLYLAMNSGILPEGTNFAIKSSLLLSLLPDTTGLVAEKDGLVLTNEEIFANYSKAVVMIKSAAW